MKIPSLLNCSLALAIGLQAQTSSPNPAPPPILVLGCSWTKTHRSEASAADQATNAGSADQAKNAGSNDQVRKGKDAALDQQIGLADRAAADGDMAAAVEAQALRNRQRSQVELIRLPAGVVNGYLYQVEIKNVTDRTIKGLHWSHVFTDSVTQKEIVRHEFYRRLQIRPGERKKLAAFTRRPPPAVIDVKDLSGKSSRSGNETVVSDKVEFADGTEWQPPVTVAQGTPANN